MKMDWSEKDQITKQKHLLLLISMSIQNVDEISLNFCIPLHLFQILFTWILNGTVCNFVILGIINVLFATIVSEQFHWKGNTWLKFADSLNKNCLKFKCGINVFIDAYKFRDSNNIEGSVGETMFFDETESYFSNRF